MSAEPHLSSDHSRWMQFSASLMHSVTWFGSVPVVSARPMVIITGVQETTLAREMSSMIAIASSYKYTPLRYPFTMHESNEETFEVWFPPVSVWLFLRDLRNCSTICYSVPLYLSVSLCFSLQTSLLSDLRSARFNIEDCLKCVFPLLLSL